MNWVAIRATVLILLAGYCLHRAFGIPPGSGMLAAIAGVIIVTYGVVLGLREHQRNAETLKRDAKAEREVERQGD